MSNDLKRVGLVFTQEGAVDFKKSLQEINLEMNKNYNQFKLTQAQWDSSTKSTEKLKAQQEYLTNAYEIQEDKVKTLRMQVSDLENAEEKNTTAIKKKREELLKAEVKLADYKNKIKDVENQLNNTGKKLEESGEKIEKWGNKIEKAGKKLSAFSIATGSALVASAKSAIDFEDAFTGVEKTVDGTAEQMAELKQGIRDMSKEIPSSTTEIAGVAEAAGQLGIATEDILSFTRVMIDLGNSTNLGAEEAASSLAKFANITNMSAKDYDKLGSTIVALGNNFATTEADIVAMSTRLAATGELAGLSQSQILSMATAMSSVGIEAEAGGSAMSKLLKQIQVAVETGNADLKDFAKVAGMSTKDFKKAFEKDAVSALSAFIGGLNDTKRNGKSAIAILNDMDIKEVRLSNTILSLANASELMNKAVKLGNEAWEDNTALTNEANKRYATLKSKIQMAWNKIKDLAVTIGDKLTPTLSKAIDEIDDLTEWVENLTDEQIDWIVKIAGVVTAMGPLLTILGKITSTAGGTIKTIGTFTQAIGVMKGTVTTTSTAVNGLANVFTAITNPATLACAGIGIAITGIAIAAQNAQKDTKEAFSNMGTSASDFITGIDTAKSHLQDFNSTLFASSEEQQELQANMDEIQQKITEICKTASDERRGYTQEEITQLDEYFTQLRELNEREIQIQQSIANAITQQAVTTAETFSGTLEEYKTQSQEWLNTAIQQKDKTIELINNQSIEEVALLNERYGEQANMQNEAYANEYNKIMEQKQLKIDAANAEVSEISQAYANGYFERSNQNASWYTKLQEYNQKIEEENNRHEENMQKAGERGAKNAAGLTLRQTEEQQRYRKKMKDIYTQIYKDMDESQAEQLGVWLAQVAQTEMYGGEISDETQKMVDAIMDSYDSMPDNTKKVMKQTMEGMLNGMKDKEPSLFAKASGIANGILTRLKKAFDIHSPSRKTKEIFKNVMKRSGKRN